MKHQLYNIEDFLTDETFINYCNEENEQDVLFWETLLEQNPQLVSKEAEAKKLLFTLSIKRSPQERKIELQKLKASIALLAIKPAEKKSAIFIKRKSVWLSVAASIIILMGVFLITRQNAKQSEIAYTLTTTNFKQVATTRFNERKTITLPDGSTVLMNGGSTLKIASNYNKENRILRLSGEAYFAVQPNKHKPFIVSAGKTLTTALGTSFKVKSYPDAPASSVMLTTGKVSVELISNAKSIQKTMLLPGEQANLEVNQLNLVKSKFQITQVKNWASRKLKFNSAALDEIKLKLQDTYGATLLIKNTPKKEVLFTGEFENESLLQVLDAISFANKFRYEVKDNTIHLIF